MKSRKKKLCFSAVVISLSFDFYYWSPGNCTLVVRPPLVSEAKAHPFTPSSSSSSFYDLQGWKHQLLHLQRRTSPRYIRLNCHLFDSKSTVPVNVDYYKWQVNLLGHKRVEMHLFPICSWTQFLMSKWKGLCFLCLSMWCLFLVRL